MQEDYVRPVTVGREEPRSLGDWPFRLFGALVFLALVYGVYFLVFHLHLTGAGNSQG